MSTTVCKFGGSSMSDAGMFMRVRRIIESSPLRKYIVVSAPGKRVATDEKITDLLYRAHETNANGDHSILAQIFERYASIRDALVPGFNLEQEFAQLRKNIGLSADYAASRGEYLCAKLFAAYARMPFVDAADVLRFDDSGQPDFRATRRAVQEILLPLGRAVVPGFYGALPDGSIRTFSRGGSDVSGAMLAAALGAQFYENWTDVDGLYTADPSIVAHPQRNRKVSLEQMEEISAAGARLLHPDALKPLRGTGIDTLLKNTFAPGAPGTRISESCSEIVCCVTGLRNLYLLEGKAGTHADQDVVLYPYPVPGSVKVASVSAFGLSSVQVQKVEAIIKPIHIIHMQKHTKIIVPQQEFETAIQIIHKILMENLE